jgi:hypothetical protein
MNLKMIDTLIILEPSFFTITIFFFISPYWSNDLIKFLAKVWLIVFVVLNKLIVMCFGYQLIFKEVNNKSTHIMCFFNIHKSKLITVIHFVKVGQTYNCLHLGGNEVTWATCITLVKCLFWNVPKIFPFCKLKKSH